MEVLLVDSDHAFADRIRAWLPGAEAGRIRITQVDRLHSALRLLRPSTPADARTQRPDLVLLNLSLPDLGGPAGFTRLSAAVPGVPVIVLTTRLSERLAPDVRRLGAAECLPRDQLDASTFRTVLEKVLPSRAEALFSNADVADASAAATRTKPTRSAKPVGEPPEPAALNALDDATYVCTIDGRVLHWSAAAAALYGVGEDGVQHLDQIVPEDARAEARDVLKRVGAGGPPTTAQDRRVRSDGTALLVRYTAFPLYDAEGEVVAVAFAERDEPELPDVASPDEAASATTDVPIAASGVEEEDVPAPPLILVVEDNDVSRRMLKRMLDRDYRVRTAASPTEALTLATEHVFDVLLLDIHLQERRTGVELLHAIRKAPTYRNVPAVACTAYALPGLSDRLMEQGFNAYVAKPFARQTLIDAIEGVLQKTPRETEPTVATESPDLILPPRPFSLAEVAEMITDENAADIERLTAVLESDPVVASWVLHHVNSAFYSLRGNVSSVERAVTLLGFEPICNLVLSKVLSRAFSTFDGGKPAQVYDYLQRTSVAAAAYARALAEHLEMPEAELSFTAGLLHQLGRLGLLSTHPETYASLWFENASPGSDVPVPPSVGQELLHLGADHEMVGNEIAREWQLPKKLAFIIQRQNKPLSRAVTPEALLALTVSAGANASRLLYSTHLDQGDDEGISEALGEALRVLARRFERDARELRDYLHARDEEVRELVGTIVVG